MEIKAFKMDGLGNDFVIIDQRKEKINLSNDQIIKICDRKFIGCDQLIFVKNDTDIDANLNVLKVSIQNRSSANKRTQLAPKFGTRTKLVKTEDEWKLSQR